MLERVPSHATPPLSPSTQLAASLKPFDPAGRLRPYFPLHTAYDAHFLMPFSFSETRADSWRISGRLTNLRKVDRAAGRQLSLPQSIFRSLRSSTGLFYILLMRIDSWQTHNQSDAHRARLKRRLRRSIVTRVVKSAASELRTTIHALQILEYEYAANSTYPRARARC
ncbi:hypothetical protein HYPSUDRAFT_66823 [Hypholoma sublateritium FD-334 SS-4]|uniref:Uncharacterized protein n=1 Tax=Hypholoma sublateritium (strain FD-334 SS-4) TaxID=945553 RepID=A0A0D2NVK1_HYPSF|nr:hypothetical protein HYPSUDRAFT_66823 [Hypholoma sublateritium FD-334 SS-4]